MCACVCMCVCVKKLKKTNNPKFYEFMMKADVERYGYNNLLQDLKFMKSVVKIAPAVSSNVHRYVNNTFHELKFPLP